MTVGASCDMDIEGHHIVKKMRAVLGGRGAGKKVEFTDYSIFFPQNGHKFVRVVFPADLEEEPDEIPADSADFHRWCRYMSDRRAIKDRGPAGNSFFDLCLDWWGIASL